MKKIYIFCMCILTLFLVTSVFASTSITVNSITQKNRDGNVINSAQNVGDQIFVDANIYDSNGINDVKSAYLSWDNSWVDCYSRNVLNCNNINFKCIVTVTPFMNHATDLYLNIQSNKEGFSDILLGNYKFNGKPFPVNVCTVSLYCKNYNQVCTNQCFHNRCSLSCSKTCTSYGSRTVCGVQ